MQSLSGRVRVGLALALALTLSSGAGARVLVSQADALAETFGDAELDRQRLLLSEEEHARLGERAGSELSSRLIVYYEAKRDGQVVGRAYFDDHVVRTMPEVVMIALEADGAVRRVETLAFHEPRQYEAPRRWLAQYDGKSPSSKMKLGRDIAALGGATLTARAIDRAIRRSQAIDQLVRTRAVEAVETSTNR